MVESRYLLSLQNRLADRKITDLSKKVFLEKFENRGYKKFSMLNKQGFLFILYRVSCEEGERYFVAYFCDVGYGEELFYVLRNSDSYAKGLFTSYDEALELVESIPLSTLSIMASKRLIGGI